MFMLFHRFDECVTFFLIGSSCWS